MPLNLQASDGEFTPYIKYNSKAGRWYVKVEGQREVEVANPRLAFDMANIKTGWIMFTEGMGPISVWDKGQDMAVKPEGKYKRGFHVMVVGGDSLAGIGILGLREFSSTAGVVNTAMNKMYEIYEQQSGQHPGQVPFYQCTGVKPITGMYGTNYEPLFNLIGWVDRAKVPDFDKHLAATPPGREVFPPPGVSQGMPDPNAPPNMAAHGPAPTQPQGGGAYFPPQGDIADDEIPF